MKLNRQQEWLDPDLFLGRAMHHLVPAAELPVTEWPQDK